MIRAIGNDQTATPPARPSKPGHGTTTFADTFRSVATAEAPASFLTRRTQPTDTTPSAAEADTAKLDEAVAAFKKELSMTPAERVRRDVLKSMDLTEDAIETLPPKERVEVEQKVAMEVARRMKIMQGGGAPTGPSTASAVLG